MANRTTTLRSSVDVNLADGLRAIVTGCAGFIDRLNAAINVARAVENHRLPLRRDLIILGIEGDLPRL